MNSYLTTSDERERFIEWLEKLAKQYKPIGPRPIARTQGEIHVANHEHLQGSYEAILQVIANVKTGGKL